MSFPVGPKSSQPSQPTQSSAVQNAPTTTALTGTKDVPTASPIQFHRSKGPVQRLVDGIVAKIREARGAPPSAQSEGPHATFHLGRTSLRGKTSNDIQGVKTAVFGEPAARTRVKHEWLRADLKDGKVENFDARLDIGLKVKSGGGMLSGYSVSAAKDKAELDLSRPVVLFLSGSGGSAEKWGGRMAAHYAQEKNCNFVALNYRGYGHSSEVSPTEKTITEDGFAMVNHLLELGFPPDKIIIHGFSLGASVASRLQASIESSGHKLGGVIYDRPMSSATGAAKSVGEDKKASSATINLLAFGTKITSGAISTRRNLEDLVAHSPDGKLRSPTFLVADTGSFGARSASMGRQFNMVQGQSTGDHENHFASIEVLNKLPGLDDVLA
jgi:pimeloyl-ACP methyl ester carboxylesterase